MTSTKVGRHFNFERNFSSESTNHVDFDVYLLRIFSFKWNQGGRANLLQSEVEGALLHVGLNADYGHVLSVLCLHLTWGVVNGEVSSLDSAHVRVVLRNDNPAVSRGVVICDAHMEDPVNVDLDSVFF